MTEAELTVLLKALTSATKPGSSNSSSSDPNSSSKPEGVAAVARNKELGFDDFVRLFRGVF